MRAEDILLTRSGARYTSIAPMPVEYVLLGASCFLVSGCSLIGLGIGASTPKYEQTSLEDAVVGDHVFVEKYDEDIEGTLASVDSMGGSLELSRRNEPHRALIPKEQIEKLSRRKGSYWAMGLGLSMAIDFTVIVVTGIFVKESLRCGWGMGGGSLKF